MKRVLNDAHIEIEINLPRYFIRVPERYAQELEYEAKNIKEFLRDHRSMDIHDVYVVREYIYKCEYCGYSQEEDEQYPECCEKAIQEWKSESSTETC